MTSMERQANNGTSYNAAWEEPLPHAFAPQRSYLRRVRGGRNATDAVVICLHGRGDSIDDMVGTFLPVLAQRYGGTPSFLRNGGEESDEHEESGTNPANVAVIGLEARDNVWYPQSHHATGEGAQDNAPFQYSALERLRLTLVDVVFRHAVPPQRVAVVGFSQGAMLANSYVMSILQPHLHDSTSAPMPLLPLPAHTLALAGSLFAEAPPFPWRLFHSEDEEVAFSKAVQDEYDWVASDDGDGALLERLLPSKAPRGEGGLVGTATVRLLCGTADRFFKTREIEDAAATIARACTAAAQGSSSGDERDGPSTSLSVSPNALASAAARRLKISVGFEPNAPHQITHHMMAAIVSAIDAMLLQSK